MRVLYSGDTFCDLATFKRLVLIADEIGFMDRPSVTFKEWGTIGRDSEIRSYETSGLPILLSAHSPPSGPVTELYSRYIEADLENRDFIKLFLEGLATDPQFASKFIKEQADYGTGRGSQILSSLVSDHELLRAPLSDPIDKQRMFRFATHQDRIETLKVLAIEASVQVTNALVISEKTGLVPVANDPYLCRLIGFRTSESPYVGSLPRFAPALGIAVAKALVPDEVLAKLKVTDLFRYREATKEAYDAWSVEINRLAAQMESLAPEKVKDDLLRMINTEVAPRVVEYRREMKSARDKLFGDLIKKVVRWEFPSLSLAYLASLDIAGAIVLFASALAPAIPSVVDYYERRRDISRRNTMAYLIGLSSGHADDV